MKFTPLETVQQRPLVGRNKVKGQIKITDSEITALKAFGSPMPAASELCSMSAPELILVGCLCLSAQSSGAIMILHSELRHGYGGSPMPSNITRLQFVFKLENVWAIFEPLTARVPDKPKVVLIHGLSPAGVVLVQWPVGLGILGLSICI